jgi:myo-inositol 2-dehydrogenase/D-chiro-inositol 1-dehydrogenase
MGQKNKEGVMLRVGLLGAGRIGKVHAKAIAGDPDSQLVAISDALPENAEQLAAECGIEARSSQAILEDASVDAVLIATSTNTHCDLIEAACAAGKAVLCEKPVDLDLARARICLERVTKTGQPVMIGFNRRFDANFQALKKALEAGDIGKAEMLSVTSFDPAPPPISYIKVSGGIFRDMMIHDFDMAHFIMGDLPVQVIAAGSSLVDPQIGEAGDLDTAIVTLIYADGRLAVIRNSRRAAYGYDQRLELLGSDGLLQAENILENSLVTATRAGVVSAKPTWFFLERYMAAYQTEWAAFVAALKSGAPMPVTLADGVAALTLAEAAARSVASGQPVSLIEI